jgi:glycosyltransferase involved in cell wall biosynthesis
VHIHPLVISQDLALDGYDCSHLRVSMAALRTLQVLHAAAPLDTIEFADVGGEGYFTLAARRASGDFAGVTLAVRLHLCDHIVRSLNRWTWENRWFATVRAMERFCLRHADVLLAPSQLVANWCTESEPAASSRIRLLRYPFSPDLMHAAAAAYSAPESTTRPRVLYTGRLEHRKGVETLVRAAVSLLSRGCDADFCFIGADTFTGPAGQWMKPHLMRLVPARFSDRFEFHVGQMPRDLLASHLRAADICCFPALADNFPFAMLEAMHEGRPIITTTGCGVSEVLTHERDALIVPPRDEPALAAAIERLIRDPALRAALGAEASRTLAANCDPVRIARAYDASPQGATAHPSTLHPGKRGEGLRSAADVTIIIPVYNTHHHLAETLESVKVQSLSGAEVIIIDDGSTDPATTRFLDSLPDVRVIRQSNTGLSGARNAGCAHSNTRWVLPLDSDDLLEPRCLERLLHAARCNPRAVYVTSLMSCFFESEPGRAMVYIPLGFERDLLAVWNCAGPCTGLLDREVVLSRGGYDPAMTAFEDWDLYCGLAAAGHSAVVVPEFLIRNRIRSGSMLRSLGRRKAEMLRSMMLAKHSGLSTSPELTMRMLVGELLSDEDLDGRPDPRQLASDLVRENFRYRAADRLNASARQLGIHRLLKRMLGVKDAQDGPSRE